MSPPPPPSPSPPDPPTPDPPTPAPPPATTSHPLNPVLRTPRLTLRLLEARDREGWLAAAKGSEAFWQPWMTQRPRANSLESEFEIQLQRTLQGAREGTGYRFVAEHEGRLAVFVSVNNIVRGAFLNGTLGWRVTPEAQGQGLAFEGVRAVVRFCFAAPPAGLGLHRVDANIMPRNERSLALADRLGFRREGLGRAMLNIAGRWEDHVMCALLADEVNARDDDDNDDRDDEQGAP